MVLKTINELLMPKVMIVIIRFYQLTLSFLFKVIGIKLCRFEPSCSNYAILALKKYGFTRGFVKTMGRIFRCNPFNNNYHYIDYP